MAQRRRKRRAQQAPGHAPNAQAKGVTQTDPAERTPKSMVIRMGAGEVGPSVTQLVHDMRSVMEPHTAARLKERKSNKLRDYTTMAGPLGVTHLLLFSRSPAGNTNLRVGITPRGPTLNFRVEKYSLCRDVVKAQRRPKAAGGDGVDHFTPPLLVMNNFTTPSSSATTPIPKHLETLTTSVFQSLFPPISPQQTPLRSIRRVLLLNRETDSSAPDADGTYVLNLRHYAVTTRPVIPLSRGLKRLRAAEKHLKPRQKPTSTTTKDTDGPSTSSKSRSSRHPALPNMSRLDDVADYVLDPAGGGGYTSASESEIDTDAEVEVLEPATRRVNSKRQNANASRATGANAEGAEENTRPTRTERPAAVQKRAVKLSELGPRLTLRLVKVEEGLCDGRVMWHEFVKKSAEQVKEQDAVWVEKRRLRDERKRVQRENVERKMKKRGAEEGKEGNKEGAVDGEAEGDFDDDEWDEEMDDVLRERELEQEEDEWVDDDEDEEMGEEEVEEELEDNDEE